MSASLRRLLWMSCWLLIGAVAGISAVIFFGKGPPVVVAVKGTSQPSTMATTAVSATGLVPPSMQAYGDVLHADFANYPVTRPWAYPVELADAAHVVLNEPVYVCPRGDLWITHRGADALQTVLGRASDETEHIIDQPVEYVLWVIDDRGKWSASAVCRKGSDYELVSAKDRRMLPSGRAYEWSLAFNWDDDGATRLVAPTDGGVSVITLGKEISEAYLDLMDMGSGATTRLGRGPCVEFDNRGILAWMSAEGDKAPPLSRVGRFVNGKWDVLDAGAWPSNIIHMVPMLDGSVLQIRRGSGPGTIELSVAPLDLPAIDEKEVAALAQQLGDEDAEKRIAAFRRLTQYGPGVFPILEKLKADADPEAQTRIQELLEGKLTTRLGGMLVNENKLSLAARLADGGAIFFAPAGVTIAQEQQEPRVVQPDYLAVRPGRAIVEVPEEITKELAKHGGSIAALRDEWIVTTPTDGMRRFLGGQFEPLLRDDEKQFDHVAAIDGRGRWVLRSQAATGATTQPTLIIDPTVPEPTPRLAMWLIDAGDSVGWSKADWPVFAKGNAHWIVNDRGWEVMDESKDAMLTDVPPATRRSTTAPAATSRTVVEGRMLYSDAAGNEIFGGEKSLTLLTARGERRDWQLPEGCVGDGADPVWLWGDRDRHLFLFNGSSRIIRLGFKPEETEPFVLEAIFSKNIPMMPDIQRAWLDPGGRIAVSYARMQLAVIFPAGQIPPELEDKILVQNIVRSEPQKESDHGEQPVEGGPIGPGL